MPRFFFDFRQHRALSPDNVGNEFATTEQAYLEAFKAAQEMWSDLLAGRRDPRRCAFEVHDGEGHLLFVLPFEEVLESCRDRNRVHQALQHTMREAQVAAAQMMRKQGDFQRELDATRQTLRQSAALIATPI